MAWRGLGRKGKIEGDVALGIVFPIAKVACIAVVGSFAHRDKNRDEGRNIGKDET